MFVYLVKNFITSDECRALNEWIDAVMHDPVTRPLFFSNWSNASAAAGHAWTFDKRLTTRNIEKNSLNNVWDYPELAYNIFKKIRIHLNFENQPIISGHGKNGIVVSSTLHEGFVHEHTDPGDPQGRLNYEALRCNILSSSPVSGGALHIEDKTFNLEEGDLICYLVSKYPHRVEKCFGDKKRNLWMFGLLVDSIEWETNKKEQLLNRPHMDFIAKATENQ